LLSYGYTWERGLIRTRRVETTAQAEMPPQSGVASAREFVGYGTGLGAIRVDMVEDPIEGLLAFLAKKAGAA
jgi:hypothetical protein